MSETKDMNWANERNTLTFKLTPKVHSTLRGTLPLHNSDTKVDFPTPGMVVRANGAGQGSTCIAEYDDLHLGQIFVRALHPRGNGREDIR